MQSYNFIINYTILKLKKSKNKHKTINISDFSLMCELTRIMQDINYYDLRR